MSIQQRESGAEKEASTAAPVDSIEKKFYPRIPTHRTEPPTGSHGRWLALAFWLIVAFIAVQQCAK